MAISTRFLDELVKEPDAIAEETDKIYSELIQKNPTFLVGNLGIREC